MAAVLLYCWLVRLAAVLLYCWLVRLAAADVYTLWKQADLVSARMQEQTFLGLVQRTLGNQTLKVEVGVGLERGRRGEDRVVLNYKDGVLQVNSTTGTSAAWGLNHFLKYRCNSHISWETSNVNTSACRETVSLVLQANDLYRYYQNVCTPGYSFVWWGWKEWERHIDWMALNGINLPLAFSGQEEIWRRVWTKLGVSQEGIDAHFTGPAFLPWGRMGNLKGWGGPLSASWLQAQALLQHNILDRMRDFGMIPVLPAFAGLVPDGFADLHPSSNYSSVEWQGFGSNYSGVKLLDPTDPLFQIVGSIFIREQTEEFGSNHVYNCDTFNEMRPPSSDPQFIHKVGQSIYSAMKQADGEAVWMMQGWLFLDDGFWREEQIRALLNSVDGGRMLLLDLDSADREQYTRTQSYYGQPFIFNMINNYGGQLALFGRNSRINSRPFQARSMVNSSLVGTGFTPEGIHSSYAMFDLMSEMSWRAEPVPNLEDWFEEYSDRRYGQINWFSRQAWRILSRHVFNSEMSNYHEHVLLIKQPGLGMQDMRWYSMEELYKSWGLMLAASNNLPASETFKFDLVDITRQALVNTAPVWYDLACKAYESRNIRLVHEEGLVFIDLLTDLDAMLGTNVNFMLGPWLEAAKQAATSQEESRIFEFNARNQISLWGPDGQIMDYAGKQWSGLVSDYYIPRWRLFFKHLEASILNGTSFQADIFRKDFLEKIGKPFCTEARLYPTSPSGDPVQMSKFLFFKWSKQVKRSS